MNISRNDNYHGNSQESLNILRGGWLNNSGGRTGGGRAGALAGILTAGGAVPHVAPLKMMQEIRGFRMGAN